MSWMKGYISEHLDNIVNALENPYDTIKQAVRKTIKLFLIISLGIQDRVD